MTASLRWLSGVAALAVASTTLARAQDTAQTKPAAGPRGPAVLTGTVVAAQTGLPLMGIQVLVKGTRRWALTDLNGAFRLERLKPGPSTIEFRHPHRAALTYDLTLAANETTNLAVKLDTNSVALPEIVVEGNDSQPAAKMHDFDVHRIAGHGGYFITRKEIEDKQPRLMSEMLRRVPGLRVDCDFGSCQVQSFEETRRLGSCRIQYFLDGAPFQGDIDELTPDQVEGIEIYRGSSSIPPQFNTGTSMCGVIAVWSRVPRR